MLEIVLYSLPRFGSAMMGLMVAVYLAPFYTDTLLLAPSLVAWTFLIGRVWDGVNDPLMGYISDKTKFKMGRRRPYFLIAAIPTGIGFYLLWSPPEALQDTALFLWLTATYLLAYTCWTMFMIPHNALGAELTMDYHRRSVLTGVREALGTIGLLVGAILPAIVVLVLFKGDARQGYSTLAIFTGAMTALFMVLCFFSVKENPDFQKRHTPSMLEGLKALGSNRPFRILVGAFLLNFVGQAFVPLMTPYVVTYVLKTTWSLAIPCIVGSYCLGVIFSLYFWVRLSRRIGKKEALSYGLLIAAAAFAITITAHEGMLLFFVIVAGVSGVGCGSSLGLSSSMLADTIDLDELETGTRREGAYFGIWSVIDKAGIGLTAFIALQAIDIVGYVPNVEQTPTVYWTIKGLFAVVPPSCFVASYLLLRKYPITQKEHARIRAEIAVMRGSQEESA